MVLDIQFVPNHFLSSTGHLMVPEHQGEMPVCHLLRGWNLDKLSSEKVSMKVGRSKDLISISSSDLIDKLKLNAGDIDRIRGEEDLSTRALMLKNIVKFHRLLENQELGILFFNLCSQPIHLDLRRNHLENFLQQIQPLLDSNNISFSYLTESFKNLLEEYIKSPYENFLPLAEKLLNKISLEGDREVLNIWLDSIFSKLQSSNRNEFSQILDMIRLIQSSPRPALLVEDESSSHSQGTAAYKTYLRVFGSDSEVVTHLELDNWETKGNKEEALKRIIEGFRKQSRVLDLSNLDLTDLPDSLRKFSWIKDLNLSCNKIKSLTSLSDLRYLITLDLSYNNMGGDDGILNFIPLNNLERLRLVKLHYMGGNYQHMMERLRLDLTQCDRIEWVNNWGQKRVLSRREGELLGQFLRRRETVFRAPTQNIYNSSGAFSTLTLTSLQDNPKDSEIIAGSSEALKKLKIKESDISSLISKDSNIMPWLNRLVVEKGVRGLAIWNDTSLRPALSSKILEILDCAKKYPEFINDILTPLIATSVTDCGDNTLYYFNEIVRRMELFKAKELPLERALPIFRKYFPVFLIKEVSKKSINERLLTLSGYDRDYLEKEALGVELDFLIRFKDEFQVPLALSKGRYLGAEVETRKNFLESAKASIRSSLSSNQHFIQYLSLDPEWRTYLLAHDAYLEGDLASHKSTIDLAIEGLETRQAKMSSSEYQRGYLDLMKKDRDQSASIIANATERLLRAHNLI